MKLKFLELFARSAAGSALAIYLSVVCAVGLTVGVEYFRGTFVVEQT